MSSSPGKYNSQIHRFFIVVLELSAAAVVVGVAGVLWYRHTRAPYDWPGRAVGGGILGAVASYLLLMNLDKNIAATMQAQGKTYRHAPDTPRTTIARGIWVAIALVLLSFLLAFAWLAMAFRG